MAPFTPCGIHRTNNPYENFHPLQNIYETEHYKRLLYEEQENSIKSFTIKLSDKPKFDQVKPEPKQSVCDRIRKVWAKLKSIVCG